MAARKKASNFIEEQEGPSGDAFIDSVLQQKDGYSELYHGERPPGDPKHLEVKEFDGSISRWFVKMSKASLEKIKQGIPPNKKVKEWIEVRKEWVLANHKEEVIQSAVASKDGFTPKNALGVKHGSQKKEVKNGSKKKGFTYDLVFDECKPQTFVIMNWRILRVAGQRMKNQGFHQTQFSMRCCSLKDWNDYQAEKKHKEESLNMGFAKEPAGKYWKVSETKLLDIIDGKTFDERRANVQILKN